MAELLKNMFSAEFVSALASALKKNASSFDQQSFIKAHSVKEYKALELKDRMHFITQQMHEHLPVTFRKQVEILDRVAPSFTGFVGTIFPNFIEKYGRQEVELSMEALKRYTPYSTSEFAVRPFLNEHPELIKVFYTWAKDSNHHVRRLASEGCRPLLPWASRLPHLIQNPEPILPILKTLKSDPSDYVHRSVANNLNDISKHHPALVLKLAQEWKGKTEITDWVLKHALRTQLKKGNAEAMSIFGFKKADSSIEKFEIYPPKIKIGDSAELDIALRTGRDSKVRIEYQVHYVKKNGSTSTKVFQLSETEVKAKTLWQNRKKVDFRDLSTRVHYAGIHRLDLKINGVVQASTEIELENP